MRFQFLQYFLGEYWGIVLNKQSIRPTSHDKHTYRNTQPANQLVTAATILCKRIFMKRFAGQKISYSYTAQA